MGRHRREPQVCRDKGHAWKQKSWGIVGIDICARWNCDAERVNPLLDPPPVRRNTRSRPMSESRR